MQDYREQFYSKNELQKIEGDLITLPELQRVLKKKSPSSIAHLIMNKKIKVQKILGKNYTTKLDLFHFFYPELLSEVSKNKDWTISPEYRKFLGLNENDVLISPDTPKKVVRTKSGREVLEDNKTQYKANRDTLKIRIKR